MPLSLIKWRRETKPGLVKHCASSGKALQGGLRWLPGLAAASISCVAGWWVRAGTHILTPESYISSSQESSARASLETGGQEKPKEVTIN